MYQKKKVVIGIVLALVVMDAHAFGLGAVIGAGISAGGNGSTSTQPVPQSQTAMPGAASQQPATNLPIPTSVPAPTSAPSTPAPNPAQQPDHDCSASSSNKEGCSS